MMARLLRRRSSLWKISLWVLAVTVLTLISAVGYVVLDIAGDLDPAAVDALRAMPETIRVEVH